LECECADLVGKRLGSLLARAVVDDDTGARLRELARNGGPDPARSPRDEGDLAVERAEGVRQR
jgi:hypothetical protein